MAERSRIVIACTVLATLAFVSIYGISRVGVLLAGPCSPGSQASVLSAVHGNNGNETLVRTNGTLATGGPRRQRSSSAVYVPLPPPLESNGLISFGGCCGIGHRLGRNLPAIVYGVTRRTRLVAAWDDVRWDVLFNRTPNIVAGERQAENFDNGVPEDWSDSPMARREETGPMREGTPYERYGQDSRYLFEMGLAWSVVNMLRDNLSPLVRSFLDPMREQYRDSDLHLCTHIRQGNNETGDWEKKKWRHIDFHTVANATLSSMRHHAVTSGATKVTVFVASDSDKTRPWFESHVPEGWSVVRPGRVLPRPESGVWFGEALSSTNAVLSQKERDEAMAEAVADVFALGECDALYLPNFSSFSQVGIMLARAEGNRVLFMDLKRHDFADYPPPMDEISLHLIHQNSGMRDEIDELRNQIAQLKAIEYARLMAQGEASSAANATQ